MGPVEPANDPGVSASPSVTPSAAEKLSKGDPQRFCSRRDPVVADVDGDGREDQVFHSWVKGQALVGVCTAAGKKDSRPGLGMSELLQIIDFDGDGRDEIFFGSTGITIGSYEVTRFLRGRLRLVRGPLGGEPMVVRQGAEFTNRMVGRAFGCEDIDEDGTANLVQVTTRFQGQDVRWKRTWYSVRGASAERVGHDGGSEPRGEGESRIDVLMRAARDHVRACEARESS